MQDNHQHPKPWHDRFQEQARNTTESLKNLEKTVRDNLDDYQRSRDGG